MKSRASWLKVAAALCLVLLTGLIALATGSLIPLVAADATCTTRLSHSLGTSTETAGSGTKCFSVTLPAGSENQRVLKISLKVEDSGSYDVYIAAGGAVSRLGDEDKYNFFAIDRSSIGATFVVEQPSSSSYTIAVVPGLDTPASSRYDLTIDNRSTDFQVASSSGSCPPGDSDCLTTIPSEVPLPGVRLAPGSAMVLPFDATCPGQIWLDAAWTRPSAWLAVPSLMNFALFRADGVKVVNRMGGSKGSTIAVKYVITPADLAKGGRWWAVLTNNGARTVTSYVSVTGNSTACTLAPATPAVKTTFFQQGRLPGVSYLGASDTVLSQAQPDARRGADLTCLADGDDPPGSDKDLSTLLRWDITAIPAGSRVRAATITLNITDQTEGTYQLYEVKRNWSESQATWNHYRSNNAWAAPGARDSLDRGAASLGTLHKMGTGKAVITLNSQGIALVQRWVDGPGSNYGLLLAYPETRDGVDFDCSEAASSGNRPILSVTHEIARS